MRDIILQAFALCNKEAAAATTALSAALAPEAENGSYDREIGSEGDSLAALAYQEPICSIAFCISSGLTSRTCVPMDQW